MSEDDRDHNIRWVKAHSETHQATDSFDLWRLLQSRAGDKCASVQMNPLSDQLQEIFAELQGQNERTQRRDL